MLTIIPISFWAILALLIVGYCFFGIHGVIGVVVLGILARNL